MQVQTKLLRPKQVCEQLAISNTTLWRLVKAQKLTPIKISSRATAFKLTDIENHIQSCLEVNEND